MLSHNVVGMLPDLSATTEHAGVVVYLPTRDDGRKNACEDSTVFVIRHTAWDGTAPDSVCRAGCLVVWTRPVNHEILVNYPQSVDVVLCL